MPKNAQTTAQLHSSHMLANNTQNSPSEASTVHEPRTSRCSSWIQKAEKPEIKLPTSVGSSKKQKSSRKTSTSALLTMPKPLIVQIMTNCGKFLRDGNTRPPYLPPEKSVCWSRSNSQSWTWNNKQVPNRERSMSRLCFVTLLYLTSMKHIS